VKKIAVEEHCNAEAFDKIETRLKDMDAVGIDMQVLSHTLFYDESNGLSMTDVTANVRKMNETLFKIVQQYPKRFDAFAILSIRDPKIAAEELERYIKEYGFKGTMIGQEVRGEYLDEPKYGVLLEMAQKLDIPIYVHPTRPAPDMIAPYMTYPVLAGSTWGLAAQAGLHAMRMIFGGVFDRYPDLKIILGHLGESIPFQMWRIDNRWAREKERNPQTESDEIAFNLKRKPSQYFQENFYVTTSGMFWVPAIELTYKAVGADRILFAVDYPAEPAMDEAVRAIENLPISNGDKEKIFHLNAEKLLKLMSE